MRGNFDTLVANCDMKFEIPDVRGMIVNKKIYYGSKLNDPDIDMFLSYLKYLRIDYKDIVSIDNDRLGIELTVDSNTWDKVHAFINRCI